MAWTSPMTAVAGSSFTAADFNREIRDNLMCTAPARAGVAGSYFIADSLNNIVERQIFSDTILAAETRTSSSYGDLASEGPAVTVTTHACAIVWLTAKMSNDTANYQSNASVEVSGATSIPAIDNYAIYCDGKPAGQPEQSMSPFMFTTLRPGSNTFTMKYRIAAGGTSTFSNRHIAVMPL